ncbi:hypothetical protein ABE543_01935 [Stenotrophomonas sp. TWI169]|uniref:hypothetical protein n=1 Tax=unclassified Stenotrophomonas TaxID=196198 RepID=UPI0018D38407|nr:hypothetical protein [Stenotrophomonas sp. RS-48]MBH1664203.1 hypothetical protein [Stenotrophomonas maltophilia]MDI9249380.1 hypothetical protein [Stenotrophomonas sp. RS-48]
MGIGQIGKRVQKVVLMHGRHEAAFPTPGAELVFFNAPFNTERLARIEQVHLWSPPDDKLEALPEILREMRGLKTLSIGPGSIAPSIMDGLEEGLLPESIGALSIHLGTGTLAWPGVVLPNLRTLYVDVPVRFDTSSFPALKVLSLYPDRSLKNLRQALALPLEELNILNVPVDGEIFNILSASAGGLERLGLLGGTKLKSLDGIETLAALTSVWLKNLSSLTDIRALVGLEQLRKLDIQYCKKIANIEVINDLSALRELTLVGCGKVGLKKIQAKIESLQKRTIGATT